MELTRIVTRLTDEGMLYAKEDGDRVLHPAYFQFDGREYFFLSGFYYDLEPRLINHIFRIQDEQKRDIEQVTGRPKLDQLPARKHICK